MADNISEEKEEIVEEVIEETEQETAEEPDELALAEEKLFPTSIAGTSSGSIVAGLYSIGVKPTEMKKIIYNLSKNGASLLDPSYKEIISAGMSLLSSKEIHLTGLMKGNKLEKFINNYTKNKNINDVKMPIIIPTVDLNSGKTVVFTNAKNKLPNLNKVIWESNISLSKAIRASSSVPGIFEPIFIRKYCLVDGGLTDVLPVDLLIESGENYDEVIAIGPLIMMKFVVATTKPHNIKTVVSMNPIMIDGTGMCGGCRLTVGGKTKFACVDGPDFDGFEVDFDEAISRSRSYTDFEKHAYEEACNLYKKEVK